MGFEPCHRLVVRRPTAVSIATQDLGERGRTTGQSLAIGQRAAVQALGHDFDAPADAQVLNADFAQGEVEVAKHGIEEGLRQSFSVGLAPQPIDHQGSVQGQRIEAPVERIGNGAGLEQLGGARITGCLCIKRGGKGFIGLATAEHELSILFAARAVDPRRPSRHLVRPLSDEPKKPSMRRTVPLATVPFVLAALLLAACDNPVDIRGFSPAPGAVDKLEVNTQSREDVQRLIGTPSAVATFNPNIWYYISQKQEFWGPSRPWISDQNVIQITFNESGRVQTIKYYDLNDAQNITMVARITPTSGKELTVLEQILGNVGKFSGPRQSGNPGAPTSSGL